MSATDTVKKHATDKKPATDWRVTTTVYAVVLVVVIVALLLLTFAPDTVVYLMRKTATVLGFGTGATVGSVPTFVEGIQRGIEAAR